MNGVAQLSDCDLNEKIAVLCGLDAKMCPFHLSRSCCGRSLPKYCSDLNAIHEAEKLILEKSDGMSLPDLWDKYYANLRQGSSIIIHADARRRAEAFVETFEESAADSVGRGRKSDK